MTPAVLSGRDRPSPPRASPWPDGHVLTAFQLAVTEIVGGLSCGDLVTYADVAAEAGRPGAAQAVANVLRSAPGLPWWRVVPGDGRIYRSHRITQIPVLRGEGHAIGDDGRIAPAAGPSSVR